MQFSEPGEPGPAPEPEPEPEPALLEPEPEYREPEPAPVPVAEPEPEPEQLEPDGFPKMIILCRSETFATQTDYTKPFYPIESDNDKLSDEKEASKRFYEIKIASFSKNVGEYTHKHVALKFAKYFRKIFPESMHLVHPLRIHKVREEESGHHERETAVLEPEPEAEGEGGGEAKRTAREEIIEDVPDEVFSDSESDSENEENDATPDKLTERHAKERKAARKTLNALLDLITSHKPPRRRKRRNVNRRLLHSHGRDAIRDSKEEHFPTTFKDMYWAMAEACEVPSYWEPATIARFAHGIRDMWTAAKEHHVGDNTCFPNFDSNLNKMTQLKQLLTTGMVNTTGVL